MSQKRNLLSFSTSALILWLVPIWVMSADLFRSYDLKYQGELSLYHVEDLNADGLKDILIATTDAARNRFWLYFQTATGFASQPDQVFPVPNDLIIFDIGDVAGDERKEFVYFTRRAVKYYRLTGTGFRLTPEILFETESIFMRPATGPVESYNFVSDLNGDYIDEILVPKISKSDIHFRDRESGNWLLNDIPLHAEAVVSGHFDPRFSVGRRAEAHYAVPYLSTEDFNADDRPDLIAVYRDSLAVFCQQANGFFSSQCHSKVPLDFGEIWSGERINRNRIGEESERRYLMRITDLNADSLLDAVSLWVSTKESFINPENEIRIHYGKSDSSNSHRRLYFEPEPDEVIKPDGTQLVLDILDLNHDGHIDFIIPTVNVGLRNIIRMLLSRNMQIQAETYLLGEDNVYPETPTLEIDMMIEFTYRGGATSPVYEIEDFNGDGQRDILSSLGDKTLVLFWGEENKIFRTSIGAKYQVFVPQDGELVRAMQLNNDDKCDVVIQYGHENLPHPDLKNTLRVLLAN